MRQIGPFKLYTKKPNDIKWGSLYTMEVVLPVFEQKERTVRVFLPEGYSTDKKYPVLYMADGQNIVDKYTTAYGAWDIDVREKELVEQGFTPFIVVGVDCPKRGWLERTREYTLQDVKISRKNAGRFYENQNPCSDALMDYIVNQLKPLIDQYFSTNPDKEHTAFGGSSMGGIAAFNYATKRNDIFGFSLCFSPAFFLYEKKELYDYVDSLNINPHDYGKFFFYSGAVEFEHSFLEPTKEMYQYFVSKGFDKDHVGLKIDKTQKHCEAAWNKHFAEGMKFWLKDL